jgi:hypothetical protein
MGLRDTALVGVSVVVLAVGANQALQPSTTGGDHQPPRQGQLEELSDADEHGKGRMRDEANDHMDAEERRRLAPGETRAPEPRRPRVRLRLP